MASRDDRLTTERILLLTKIPRYSDCGKLQKVVLLHGIIRMFFCDISIRKTFPRIFRKNNGKNGWYALIADKPPRIYDILFS